MSTVEPEPPRPKAIRNVVTAAGVILSTAIAVTGLIVSIMSYNTNRASFQAERTGVFIGVADETHSFIILRAAAPETVLMGADVIFPKEFEIGLISVLPPSYQLDVTPLKDALQRKSRVRSFTTFLIPVIVRAVYVARGEYYRSSSLSSIIVKSSYVKGEQRFDVLGLVFQKHVIRNDASESDQLEKAWTKAKDISF